MKILFVGGGTGGHFYPIIAVAEALNDLVREKRLLEPELIYAAPDPYALDLLLANNIRFMPVSAGKIRNYFSVLNFFDYFKTAWGILRSMLGIFFLYPDVIFSTGGYAAFPTLLAARLFRIPVVILNCDASPGRVNKWATRFAAKVAVAFAEGARYFPKEKVAHTGNPVRKAALVPAREGMHDFFKLNPEVPTVLITGGSQGSQTLNEALLAALPQLLSKYQIIHQTGAGNIADVEARAKVVMGDSPDGVRYRPLGYLNDLQTRMAAGIASMVVSRAGAGNIFELASWGLPSILVPIPEPTSHDQTKNAYAYARAGACSVIEQNNLTPGLLISEVNRILEHEPVRRAMANAARAFARPDAAGLIAAAILEIALSHEE